MKYFDYDSEKFYTEEEIRKLDFEENRQDLNNNKHDIIEGIINVESVCECISNALNGDIEDVIADLNLCWGYNIRKLNIYQYIKDYIFGLFESDLLGDMQYFERELKENAILDIEDKISYKFNGDNMELCIEDKNGENTEYFSICIDVKKI